MENYISLSWFLRTINYGCEWFVLGFLSDDSKAFSLHSSEIASFYDNIFIEKLLSSNFHVSNLKIQYKFGDTYDDEQKNVEAVSEIYLINLNNRVYIKKCIFAIFNKNRGFERQFHEIMSGHKDTELEFVCLEEKFKTINSNNKFKPIKLKFEGISQETLPHNSVNQYKYSNCKFDLTKNYNLSFSTHLFDKSKLANYKFPLKLNKLIDKLESIGKMCQNINNNLTSTSLDRAAIKYISKNIYTYTGIDKNSIMIDIDTMKTEEFNVESYNELLQAIIKIKEVDVENPNLAKFWELVQIIFCPTQSLKYYEYFNELKTIFDEFIAHRQITKKMKFGNVILSILWNVKKNNNTRLLQLIHSEELQLQLEKFLLANN